MGNIATGLLAGWNAARIHKNQKPLEFPANHHARRTMPLCDPRAPQGFPADESQLGYMPPLESPKPRWQRGARKAYAERASVDIEPF